jgi:putative addiction module component (TIGR02574 family)
VGWGSNSLGLNTALSRDNVFKDALRLPPSKRAELAHALITSLDEPEDLDAENAWEREIDRRIDDVMAERAKTEPWPTVRRRLKAQLSQVRRSKKGGR